MNLAIGFFDGLLFLVVVSTFGAAVLATLAPRASLLLAPALGIAVTALLTNALYFGANLPVRHCTTAILLLNAIAAAVVVSTRPPGWSRLLLAGTPLYVFLLLPGILGGIQYCVFRGNHWDHFNYIDIALALSSHRFSELNSQPIQAFIDNDVVVHGIGLLAGRPAAPLLFAVFLPWGLGDLHLNAFAWNTALWVATFPSAVLLWRVLNGDRTSQPSTGLSLLPPLALLAGFWGQYVFDINAWSQLAAMPVLAAATALFASLLTPEASEGPGVNRYGPAGISLVLGLLIAAGFLIYPEQTFLQAGLIGIATTVHLLIRRELPSWRLWCFLTPALVFALALAILPNVTATLGLVQQQISFGNSGDPNWYQYFDRYWFGIGGTSQPLDVALNFPAAAAGIFELAFASSDNPSPMSGMAALAVAWGGILSVGICLVFIDSLRWRKEDCAAGQFLRWLALGCSAFIGWLMFRHHLWVAGKAMSYFAPYVLLPMLSAAVAGAHFLVHWLRQGFRLLFLFSQTLFLLARPALALAPDGIGPPQNLYPSIQDASLKSVRSWRMDAREFAQCHAVAIAANVSVVREEFVKQRLTYAGIRYWFPESVTAHYNGGVALGIADRPRTDCAAVFVGHGARPETIERLPLPYCGWYSMNDQSQVLTLDGFGQPESWGVWTAAPKATIDLPEEVGGDLDLTFDIGSVYATMLGKAVDISMGGQVRTVQILNPGVQQVHLSLGTERTRRIALSLPVTESPASRGESTDTRILGLGFTRMRVGPCAADK